MKKLKSSSLNTKRIDAPPSKMKILLPYIIVTIILLHLVLFYIYYNRSIQSADNKNTPNAVAPSNLGYNQYKDIQGSAGHTDEIVILEKQEPSQAVPALMTKTTAGEMQSSDLDDGGFSEYSDKQSKGKNTKTLAEILGIERQDLIYAQGDEAIEDSQYQIDENQDNTPDDEDYLETQSAEQNLNGDFDSKQVTKSSDKQAITVKKSSKITAYDDKNMGFREADITFDENAVFDNDFQDKKAQVKTTAKKKKQSKIFVKTKEKDVDNSNVDIQTTETDVAKKTAKVKETDTAQETNKVAKADKAKKSDKTQEITTKQKVKKEISVKKHTNRNSKPKKKPTKRHVSAHHKKAKNHQPDAKESALLSVDLPKAQQKRLSVSAQDATKAKNEELQDTLSHSIADIKEINRKKIEQEIQMAKRAYDERHPQPPASTSEAKPSVKKESNETKDPKKEPKAGAKEPNTDGQ